MMRVVKQPVIDRPVRDEGREERRFVDEDTVAPFPTARHASWKAERHRCGMPSRSCACAKWPWSSGRVAGATEQAGEAKVGLGETGLFVGQGAKRASARLGSLASAARASWNRRANSARTAAGVSGGRYERLGS